VRPRIEVRPAARVATYAPDRHSDAHYSSTYLSLAVWRVCAIAPSFVSVWRAFCSVSLCKSIIESSPFPCAPAGLACGSPPPSRPMPPSSGASGAHHAPPCPSFPARSAGVRPPPRGPAVCGPAGLRSALIRRHPIPGSPSLLCMPTHFHLFGHHAQILPSCPAADVAPRLCHNKLAPYRCSGGCPRHG
jgi:hypothetical protein